MIHQREKMTIHRVVMVHVKQCVNVRKPRGQRSNCHQSSEVWGAVLVVYYYYIVFIADINILLFTLSISPFRSPHHPESVGLTNHVEAYF